MPTFKSFLKMLEEKLITFGDKAYPKNSNIVILAGGGGSGKGYQLKNLIGIEGKIFDVDRLKELALKSPLMLAKYPELKDINLRNPADVFKVHDIVNNKENLDAKLLTALKKSISTSTTELPNLIFDCTLKNLGKLKEVADFASELGYKKENIHLVWILNDIKVALKQNAERNRVVPTDVLIKTHEGAAMTMGKILRDSEMVREYLDGDVWVSFNVEGVDIATEKNPRTKSEFGAWAGGNKSQTGNFINKSNYIKVKAKGKPLDTEKTVNQEFISKIKSYVPDAKF